MATLVTRTTDQTDGTTAKGSELTHAEVDANFINLNDDKLESGDTAASLTITSADINGGTIDGATIGGTTAAEGTFTTFTSTGIDDNSSSTAVTINSQGSVGVGTTNPSGIVTRIMHVATTSGDAGYRAQGAGLSRIHI